ncbi:MAG TPA: YlxR family protein [Anaeromyxobacteraceae bacterium]|nr:YlxR family protein [Anaeromyxobacteraceae bacterium]
MAAGGAHAGAERRGSAPERTCVGCGERAHPGGLVRLRLVGGQVEVDRRRSGGRGAWLHPGAECLSRAVRRKAFARAFRGAAAVDGERLRRQLTGNGGRD